MKLHKSISYVNSPRMSGPPCKRYLIKMWPLPFLNKFSFFRFSANVTRFLILSYTHSNISCPISERLLASLSARHMLQPAEPIIVKRSQPWNARVPTGFQLQSRGLIYLNPECVLMKNVKHNITKHSVYTLYWASCPIYIALTQNGKKNNKKNEKQTKK